MKRLFAAMMLLGLLLAVLPTPAHAEGIPNKPCGKGGYYGGADEIPPGSGGVYGALLLATTVASVSSVDKDGDRWNCWGPGVFKDNAGKIPEPTPYSRGEQITQGDVMGPPLGGGMCCDGSLAIDLTANTFHAAGYTEATDSRFDSSRIFRWDSNDIFFVDGVHVSQATFEQVLGEGDVFSAVYAARAADRSVWSFYNHEV